MKPLICVMPFGVKLSVVPILVFIVRNLLSSCFREAYSLVPKERHKRKESNGSTLGLCVVPKESHDCTLVK